MKTQKKVCEFTLNIGVKNHDVNSDTFLTSLTCITEIIGLINNDLSPSKKLEVRVKTLNEGSFECSCFIQNAITCISAVLPAIVHADLGYYKELIATLIDILKIKKFLKGTPASKEEIINTGEGVLIKLENCDGNTITIQQKTYNYYQKNQAINNAMTKNFEKLNADNEVSTYSVKTEWAEFYSDRNDFPTLQQKRVIDEKETRGVLKNDQSLNMLKLVWDSSNKWGFVWNGLKIQAYIKDDNFFKKIDAGEKFAKGDVIIADIKIYQLYDHSINNWINDSYEIATIKDHLPRAEQIGFTIE